MIGKIISHYKILDKLGAGGMGEVYLTEDTKLDRQVALKFLPSRIKAEDSDKKRFLQEARAAAALNHPNVCIIHDINEHENQQFIVMEYIKGQTLKEIITPEPLPLNKIINYALLISDALQAAHQQDIIHRDIKSENIMVTPTNQIKVMDFGLAKLKGSVKLTKTSSTAGTMGYMSPECIHGKAVDARSDIFSFGIVLYEMLTGQLPFKGDYEAAMIYSILNEEPEPVQKHRPDLSSEFLHILNRALEKNPENRYQSMKDLLIDLKRLKRDAHKIASEQKTEDKNQQKHPLFKRLPGVIFGFFILAMLIFLIFNILKKDKKITHLQQIQITQVTTHGKAKLAAISPDGKYIIHVMEEKGKQSLWLRQVATGSNVEILPAADVKFIGLTFSNDGNYIYCVAETSNAISGTLYQLPVLGGTPIKIIDDVNSPITFSPDSRQFAFIRLSLKPISTTLTILNITDNSEKTISTQTYPHELGYWGLAWSPDGKTIACMKVDPQPGKEPNILVEISVANGSIKQLASKRWGSINQIAWLSNGKGLVISAADKSSGYFYQLWFVSFPDGGSYPITTELNNYLSVSLTNDRTTILTTRSDWISNIWVAPADNLDQARQITSGKFAGFFGIVWSPDDRLVFGSRDFRLWIMNLDGTGQKLLTRDELSNWRPAISPEGRYIVFQSWRGDAATNRIWRMDMDGGNPIALTDGEWDDTPRVSLDGKWVVYKSESSGQPAIWKVSINGGKPIQLIEHFSSNPAISPDGKFIACFLSKPSDPAHKVQLAVFPFNGGTPVYTSPLPPAGITEWNTLRWTPDGKALAFLVNRDGAKNIWIKSLDNRPAVQHTHLRNKLIYSFDWSKDGKKLAYGCGVQDDDVVLIRNFK